MSQKKETLPSLEEFQKFQDRLDKMEKKNAEMEKQNAEMRRSLPASLAAPSSSRIQNVQPSYPQRRKRIVTFVSSKIPDDPSYEDMNNNPEFVEISQTRFEFARNANGLKHGRLLVQQTCNPEEVVEYTRVKDKNTAYCLKCRKNGFFVFFAPAQHEEKCFTSKREAYSRQRGIVQDAINNFGADEEFEMEEDVQQEYASQGDASQAGPDIKRMRLEKKTFATVECQTDDLLMCNLSNRPTQTEETENEFKYSFDIHGFGSGEVKTRMDGQKLVVTGEHKVEREGSNTEKRSVSYEVVVPANVEKYKRAITVKDPGLLVIAFPKIAAEDEDTPVVF